MITAEELYHASLVEREGVCVTRNGLEVEWFWREKDAGAFIQHIYGLKPHDARKQHILIVRIKGRGPKPGDAFVYSGQGEWKMSNCNHGILSTACGNLVAGFNVNTFRAEEHISSSGGPLPWVKKDSLKLIGLKRVQFWRWHDGYSGANCGGNYFMTVPLWRWNGISGTED